MLPIAIDLSASMNATDVQPSRLARAKLKVADLLALRQGARTALVAYPRTEVASLYGAEWADFLRRSCPRDRVVDESADALATVAYRRDADVDALVRPARHWIRGHRV